MSFPDPSVAAPTLGNAHFWYGGLAFGTPAGIDNFSLISADGLDMAAVRTGDVSKPRDQGQFAGLNLFDGRDITVELGVVPQTYGTGWTARQALAAALSPNVLSETPFYYLPPYAESANAPLLVCMARCTKANWTLDTMASYGIPITYPDASSAGGGMYHVTAQFHATDPRWYVAPTTATGPIASGGSSVLNNSGTFEMRPILVVAGPCSSPAIENSTLGATLTFHDPSNPSPYDLAAGDTLTIDLDSHSVVKYTAASGLTTSVPNWFVTGSAWWNLVPGNNTIHFSTSAFAAGCGLTVKWSPAYTMA